MSHYINLGQATKTQLTPNTYADVSALGDPNQTTNVQLLSNDIAYWVTMVSSSIIKVRLPDDRGNGVVTFEKGLAVKFSALSGGQYNIFLHGRIIDTGTVYKMKGTFLGTFGGSNTIEKTVIKSLKDSSIKVK